MEISGDLVSLCFHTDCELHDFIGSLLFGSHKCHKIAFQRDKIYIDALMVLIKIQLKLSICTIQYAVSEVEMCA